MAKTKNNHKQDLAINTLEVKLRDLKELFLEKFKVSDAKFEKFVTNDFEHLREKFDWLLGLIIISILIPIFLKLFF